MKPQNCWKNLLLHNFQLPTSYCKLSPNLPSVDEVIDLIPSTVNPTLPLESEMHITKVDESLVDQVIDLIPHSFGPLLPLESEINIIQVLLVTSYSSTHGGISPVSIKPPPSNEVISFY